MTEPALKISMLGEFSFSYHGHTVSNQSFRAGKVWIFLAYLVHHRDRTIPDTELIKLLWGNGKEGGNPENALKTILHRARVLMNELGDRLGHLVIVRRPGGYCLAPGIAVTVDAEEFERLCDAGDRCPDAETQLSLYEQALLLYHGEYLEKLAHEIWIAPHREALRVRYLATAKKVIPLMQEQSLTAKLEALCRRAIAVAPRQESFYAPLLRILIDRGSQKEAALLYEELRDLLFREAGMRPSEALSTLYREAIRTPYEEQQDLQVIKDRLCEKETESGAFLCDYDFFKVLYRVQARTIARSQEPTYLALLTVLPLKGELSRRSLECCMENLGPLLCSCLRGGDVVARFSASQYVLMLPNAAYENACAILQRIQRLFQRKYPHSPARLAYTIQPLDPYRTEAAPQQ